MESCPDPHLIAAPGPAPDGPLRSQTFVRYYQISEPEMGLNNLEFFAVNFREGGTCPPPKSGLRSKSLGLWGDQPRRGEAYAKATFRVRPCQRYCAGLLDAGGGDHGGAPGQPRRPLPDLSTDARSLRRRQLREH